MKKFLAGLALALLFALPARAQIVPASGYWWNPAASGTGFVIQVVGNQMFMAGFLYSATGEANWVVSFGQMASSSQYTGPLLTFSGGQTLFGSYQPPTENPSSQIISINFTSNSTATLTWPGGGVVQIQRDSFGPGGSAAIQPLTTPEAGWWWDSSQGGRGFGIEIQGSTMFLVGYMYDDSGNPVWYTSIGSMAAPDTYVGQWEQFANGQTLNGPYRAPIVSNGAVGLAQLQFSNNHSALMTLPNLQDIQLIRFAFGAATPTLSAFSPSAAAPATTLTLTGTNFDPAGQITVTLSNTAGNYSVSIPPISVTPGSLMISVPPFVNSFTGNFTSGTVNLMATQKSNGVTLDTNTLSNFNIEQLPSVSSQPAGAGTLALINASLSEAQRLQTSAQVSPAVSAALATQVANLQTLVKSVQGVVQLGEAFELGVIGGVTITVTENNIGDVDQLILATLQQLASPGAGSAEKSAETTSSACFAAEASAYAAAMTSGASLSTLNTLALNLMQAANKSGACTTVEAFTPAYQILGGASGSGYGFSNAAGEATIASRLPGVSLFATSVQTAQPQVGLNALTSPALASQTTAVQNAILNVATLATPTTNQFINQATGQLITAIIGAQNLLSTAAPPPPGTATSSIAGTWSGTWSWIAGANNCVFNDGGLVSMNITQSGSSITGSNINATGFQVRLDSDCSLQYVDVASGGTMSGTIAGSTVNYSASLPLVKFGSPFLWAGTATFNGTNNTISGTIQAYGTTGSFLLVRQQ